MLRREPLAVALLCVVVGGLGSARAAAQERAETVFRAAREYTVRIRTQISEPFAEDQRGSYSGAGFLVDAERGWVLTNAHVVGQSQSVITVAFADGAFRPGRKVYVDSFTDVAVVAVSADEPTRPTALLSCDAVPQVGEGVGAFGHPLGMPFTGTRGIVSGKTDQWLNDLLQIDATVDHGNSGGPVISLRDGRVVGIATAGAGGSKADRLNFATPMKDVCRILELLQKGVSPAPPQMEFSLLVDEDGRHTLEVGCTYNESRWPFRPNDRILAVGEVAESVNTMSELVTALRGVQGSVTIRVQRGGKSVEIKARPSHRPSVVARRGIVIDGAVIAPIAFEDAPVLTEPAQLIVQSLEPGSTAEALGLERLDIVQTIDDHRFDDVDALAAYLGRRRGRAPVRLVFRRMSESVNRWFELHVRELPGEQVRIIGEGVQFVSGSQ